MTWHGMVPGVAYVEYFLGSMVTAKWDKIHRCIRDLKLAAQAVPIFVKTKMWSAYVYTVNKRPFGSGAHGDLKKRLAEVFMDKVTIHSPVFIKYLPKLARSRLGHMLKFLMQNIELANPLQTHEDIIIHELQPTSGDIQEYIIQHPNHTSQFKNNSEERTNNNY